MTRDWKELHHRLKASQARLERWLAPPAEEQRKIFKARARVLALATEENGADAGDLEVVEFLLAYEHYGIESSFVREVYPLRELMPVPGTPPFVLGIINVRGQILSVMDVKKFFDLPEKGLTDLNKVLVVRRPGMEVGILADAILGLRSIPLRELQPSLPTLTGIRADYLRGVTQERLAVLDAERILSDRRIVVDAEA